MPLYSTQTSAIRRPVARAPTAPAAPQPPAIPESLPGGTVQPPANTPTPTSTGIAPQTTVVAPGTPPPPNQPPSGQPVAPNQTSTTPRPSAPQIDWNLVRGAQAPGPYAAPGTEGQPFFEYPREFDGYYGNTGDITSDQRNAADLQRRNLGGFFDILSGPGRTLPITAGEIPLIEARLNFENLLKAEEDRKRAYEELVRGRAAVGSDPASQSLRMLLQSRAAEGPLGSTYVAGQQAGLANRANADLARAYEMAAEEAARRGMGGSMTGYESALLQQQARQGLTGQLSTLDRETRLANAEQQRQDALLLQQQVAREAAAREAYDQMLAEIFSETERGPIDLSGFVNQVSNPTRYIGR